jgi:hypothetical protein
MPLTSGDLTLRDSHQDFTAMQARIDELEELLVQRTLPSQLSEVCNNGGTTNYYALPFAQSEDYPEPTLNDLIEYKDMEFWQGEALKALYALKERATRDSKSSETRELNKVVYYCKRRLARLKKEV